MGNTVFPSIYSEADMSKFDFNEYGCNVDSVRDIVTGFWEKYPEMEENRIGLYIWSKIKGSGKGKFQTRAGGAESGFRLYEL